MFGTELMVSDLEKAQRARFAKAKDPYLFFADDNESAVYEEILGMKENLERQNNRSGPVRRRGRRRVLYDECG